MPAAVTVWAVELAAHSPLEEVQGSLALSPEELVFTPRDGQRPERRFRLPDVTKVRRLRGSPVLMIAVDTAEGTKRTAFYFVQPPPLERPEQQPSGLVLGPMRRSSGRKVRRQNVSYLGLWNREKKQVLREWERQVEAAVEAARRSPG